MGNAEYMGTTTKQNNTSTAITNTMKLSISQISVAICLYCSMTVAPVDGARIRGLQKRQQETVRELQDVATPKLDQLVTNPLKPPQPVKPVKPLKPALEKKPEKPALEKKPEKSSLEKKPEKPSLEKKPEKPALEKKPPARNRY